MHSAIIINGKISYTISTEYNIIRYSYKPWLKIIIIILLLFIENSKATRYHIMTSYIKIIMMVLTIFNKLVDSLTYLIVPYKVSPFQFLDT